MKLNARILLLAGAAAVFLILLVLAWAPRRSDAAILSGYVEGEALYLSTPQAGTVGQVFVARGQRVGQGAALFAMDPRSIAAQVDQAQAQTAQARAQLAAAQDSQRQLQSAALAQKAQADNAAREARRDQALGRESPGVVSQQDIDRATATAAASAAQYAAAQSQAAGAAAQVKAAAAQLAHAQAARTDASVKLEQQSPHAPGPARVEDVFFQAGEWAAANQAVVSLLPDAKVKLKFFVPETQIALYRPGGTVRFGCDGCAKGLSATIAYVSPRPEYTPPVIYSRKTRDTLVFLVEARPENPAALNPGQPVDVIPLEAGR